MKAQINPTRARRIHLILTAVLFLAIVFNNFKTQAQAVKNFIANQPFLFEENKGQLMNGSGNALSDIKYYGKQGGVYVYCKPSALSFVFTKVEKDQKISEATGQLIGVQNFDPLHQKQPFDRSPLSALHSSISTSRMDLVLLGSNPNPEITASDQQEYFENFYTISDANHGITNVHTYKALTYKNIYPHIDMILNAAKKGMEYSFLVHPGGNIDDIKLRWDGAEKSEALKNGGVKYANMLGSMEESAPRSFLDGKMVATRFVKKDAQFGFNVGNYDKNKDLVIDPTLIWSTYFGGSGDDEATSISKDKSGNIFLVGFTNSTSGIATSGAYQTSYQGGDYKAFISKFDNTGSLIWATYYGGGSGSEIGRGVSLDGAGNVYIDGYTYSNSGIATSGAYQTSYAGGGGDAFLAKFNSSGSLQWATYYGSTGEDYGFCISTDTFGYVFISGETNSTNGIATTGAYSTHYSGPSGGGTANIFLAKFSSSGSLSWATYYGGTGGYTMQNNNGLTTDASGDIYITGDTWSSSGMATSGAYQTSFAGGGDAFLTKFNSSGNLTWSTYFGGNNSDIGTGVRTDISGNIYITGNTESNSGIATSGAYQTSYMGGTSYGDAFLAKFNKSGSLQWATYYGGNNDDIGNAVSTDIFGNVFLAGYTMSNSGIATSGSYQTSLAGGYDGFLTKFDRSGDLVLATYYGGTGYDFSTGVITDAFGNVFIDGYTNSPNAIATSGSYQTSFASGYDVFLAKFNFNPPNDAGITSLQNPALTTCPGTYPVKVTLKNNGDNVLNYGVIAWTFNGAPQTSVSWKDTLNPNDSTIIDLGTVNLWPGKSTIEAWPTTVNGKTNAGGYGDTLNTIVTVDSLPSPNAGSANSICPGWDTPIGSTAVSGRTYSWTSIPTGFTSTASTSYVRPTITTKYYLTETTVGGCSGKDSVTITVKPLPYANAGKSRSVCYGNVDTLGTSSVSGDSYAWFDNYAGNISSLSDPIVKPTKTTTYYLYVTNPYSCVDSDSVTITVNPLPIANAGKDTSICLGDSVFLGTNSDTSYSYSWSSSQSGFSSTVSNPGLLPNLNTTYYLAVTSNVAGCTGFDTAKVVVNALPVATFSVSDTLFCVQDSLGLIDSSTGAVSYLWKFGDGTTDTASHPHVHHYASGGTYHVLLMIKNASGCSALASKTIYVDGSCVWPGDANYDKIDNIYDLLAIGIGYNNSGYNRLDTTTQWYAHPSEDWHKSFKSGTNYKHADCNGDGIIDSLDMAAITRNYSQTHSKTGSSITSGNPNDPALSLSISKDSVGTSDTISVQMNLGTASKSLNNIYGICYTVTYDPVNVGHAKSVSADFSNCWMGTVGKNLVYLVHNDSINGVMDIGITRTDQKNVSGYGEIGKLTIIMPDNVGGKRLIRKELLFGLENIKAIDNVEDDISLYTSGDSVLFYGYSSGIASVTDADNNIHLYPNPAHSSLQIDAGKDFISEIEVSDILGKNVLSIKYNHNQRADLNINRLVPGTYFIYILTDHGFARSRFVKD